MKKILLIFLALFLILQSIEIYAVEKTVISVIFSSEIEPYKQSWEGTRRFLEENKVTLSVSEYNLKKQNPTTIFQEILQKKPDIVFTIGTDATKLAKEKVKDIPVVFSMILNPKAFIDLNVTGVSINIPSRMKLEKIKRILPDAKRIGLIYSKETIPDYQEISQVCSELGFKLIARKLDSEKEFSDTLKELSWQIDFLLMITDTKIYFSQSVEYLLRESLKEKFPVVGLSSFYTKAGALISFDADYEDLGRQAGEIALRILSGEKPANINFLRPRKIKISLNLTTGKRLGIKISPAIIREATNVFGE